MWQPTTHLPQPNQTSSTSQLASHRLVSQNCHCHLWYFYFGHIRFWLWKINVGLSILHNLSNYLDSHQIVSQKFCSELWYFWWYLNRCKLDFDGVKSKIGLWSIQLDTEPNLPHQIYKTRLVPWGLNQFIESNSPNQIYKIISN